MSLRSQYCKRPMSKRIAECLTRNHSSVCKHGRAPCITFCGVRHNPFSYPGHIVWDVIPKPERDRWLGRLSSGFRNSCSALRSKNRYPRKWTRQKRYKRDMRFVVAMVADGVMPPDHSTVGCSCGRRLR